MSLQNIFINNFELIIPEFFLITILLTLLLYGVFYKKKKNQIFLIIKNINTIIMYFLLIILLLIINIPNISLSLLNGILVINGFTQFIKIILIILTFFCIGIQKKYIIKQKIFIYEMNILILISLLGLMLLISSNNLIILYLAIELQSLSFYILTALKKKSIFSIESSLKYFILGSIASSFILIGCSFIYGITGSINFNNIFLLISNINFTNNTDLLYSFIYAFTFIFIGLLFKIGTVPFHFWLPDVYEGAPNNITLFFAIVPKIVFISILIRFYFQLIFDLSFFFCYFFYILSLFSMLIGSLGTLQQKKIKRLLAYSSITHIGFILIGFVSNELYNISFIIFYILIYILTSINLWISYISLNINFKPIKYLTDLSNLYESNKLLCIIIIINIFSLAGIPPLGGFFSKFFIFLSAIKHNFFNLVFFSIIISILSSFYYLKIVKIIIFEKNTKKLFFHKINKFQSYILMINTQIILFIFFFPNFILININKYYLYFLI